MKRLFIILLAIAIVVLVSGSVFAEDETEKKKPSFPIFKVDASLAYSLMGGNITSHSLVGDFLFVHEDEWINDIIKLGGAYGTTAYANNHYINSVNRYFGNYKMEAFFMKNKIPYAWGLVGYEMDEFQGFWNRYLIEAGLGASVFGTQPTVLKFEAGYAFITTVWINEKELYTGKEHLWEPTHNLLFRIIASVPIKDVGLFSEEVTYFVNAIDSFDQKVISDTSFTFKIISKLSFKTSFKLQYINDPGWIDELDMNGDIVTRRIDTDGNGIDDADENVLEKSDRLIYSWVNGLVVTFF